MSTKENAYLLADNEIVQSVNGAANTLRWQADRIEQLEAERKRLRGLLWHGWNEMNAIRARSGVPLDFDGKPQCIVESFWSDMVDAMAAELGDDTTPWPSEDAKAALEQGESDAHQ